ncbi:family 20 glycosylhydrolase [Pseudoduganella namucuonensis]|uniref:beta-N-acetylhexosaminidase n=1 Tax=Pseudoduganella namucuonensis TaxID=1035707 RepID=A0A1I7LB62_9BURK|nr:family 20 glycosylhydrolase [Pseudoduganella namucuonensis]SFV06963.1 hexosaminidase [Pseudoduganella namucuonensis]
MQPCSNLAFALSALAIAIKLAPAAMAATPPPLAIPAVAVKAGASALQVRWESGAREARFVITNPDSKPLPPAGWAIYFNSMAGIETGALDGGLALEQVGGALYRLRPGAGFPGVAPGQALTVAYRHTDVLNRISKAPTGPYLVFDDASATGLAIGDYQAGMPGAVPGAAPTPQAIYQRNALADDLPAGALPPIFPTPRSLAPHGGQLRVAAMPRVTAPSSLINEAALAHAIFRRHFSANAGGAAAANVANANANAASAASAASGPPLRLELRPIAGPSSPEAYELRVDPVAGIAIAGNTAAGVAMGLQSLRDLLPVEASAAFDLPALAVSDAPRFPHRGLLLDVSRNFQRKETVFRLLDQMARYKLNTLHFHLTDDEGWRIEIAGIPELTAIGARRGHESGPVATRLEPAYGSGSGVDDPHGGGYYTRADYIEILRYAAARHIDVIPEIEMPGHARAAVKAMEARHRRLEKSRPAEARRYLLSDADDRSVYKSPQLYTDHVMNPGLESTFTFIERVVAEVAALHKRAGVPLKTMHVGGDELPDGAWEKSPRAAALMKRRNIDSTAGLWDYFYDRVATILRKRGLGASGWEEMGARKVMAGGKAKLIPNPVFSRRGFQLYVWNNTEGAEDLAYRLANGGYDVVLAPVTNLYFDMAHNASAEEPGVDWNGPVELDRVYDFIPYDYLRNADIDPARKLGKEGLGDDGRRRIRGLEGTLFTETVRDPALIDYLTMPRMLALAERAWAADPAWATEPDGAKAKVLHRAAWSGFVNALGKRVLPRLDLEDGGVRYRIAPPGLMIEGGRVMANHQLPGLALRYTTDGSDPTMASALVSGPISEHGAIAVAAFDRNGRRGWVSRIDHP